MVFSPAFEEYDTDDGYEKDSGCVDIKQLEIPESCAGQRPAQRCVLVTDGLCEQQPNDERCCGKE